MPKKRNKCKCIWNEETWCDHHSHMHGVYKNIIKKRRLKYIGDGCSRIGYRNKKFVYKIPKNAVGIRHNKIEALAYKYRQHVTNLNNKPIGQYLARCVLLKNNVLRMERIQQEGWPDTPELSLILEDVDCNQGGFDRNGHWKIYDYSIGIKIKRKGMWTGWRGGVDIPKVKGCRL
ncbi:MAG TPA: hypothetical protein VHD33_03960 [Legionellaceae bacterium]|nr:hypothetical protein [Legionellaceae bacterium]